LENDNLPKFEKKFNDYLQETITNKVGDFRMFFENWSDSIKENIKHLNESLKEIDFKNKPQTYIQLVAPNKIKMPEWIMDAMTHHHDGHAETKFVDEVHTTQLANELAHWTTDRTNESAQDMIERLHALPILESLSLYDEDLESLLDRKAHVVDFAGALQ
jgi:uncharacterized protein YPO0396